MNTGNYNMKYRIPLRFSLRLQLPLLFALMALPVIGHLLTPSALAASKATGASSKQKRPFEVLTASNGMEILALPMAKVPLVTIVLVAKAGSMTELPGTNGLTHVWEHMFFKGNKRLPNQEAFNKRIRQLGITFNGDTSAEMVRYFFTLPSKNLDDGLQFMADAISTPLLEPSELERERTVVLNEYDRNASQPGFDLNNIERMVMYGDKEYLRNPLGRRALITKTTREQLLEIKQEVFVPANCALIVAGDVDPKALTNLVNKHFENWKTPAGWTPLDRGTFPPFPPTVDIVKTHELTQNVNMQITWNGPRVRFEKEDSWAIDILIQLLSHRSGKFSKKYIDSALTLNSGFSYHTQGRAGELVLYAMTSPENAAKTKKELLGEPTEWLKPDYFNKNLLDDVRRKMKIDYKMELNKPSAFAKTLAFWWATSGLDYYNGYLPSMERVTIKDVQAVIKKYLIDKPYVATTLLNPADSITAKMPDNSAPFVEKYLKNY
jgi:zinc protease